MRVTRGMKYCGVLVHLFTSLSLIFGLLTIMAIAQHDIKLAFLCMGAAVFIDAVDGTMARYFHVKTTLPGFDGTLLDNIADYINYVFTPCFLLVSSPSLMPSQIAYVISSGILIGSAYQFCQTDAKTDDDFFKGFPSYWNFVVFYMYAFQTSHTINIIAAVCCLILIAVPIKYIYLSRMSHVTHSKALRLLILAASALYGLANLWMLAAFPNYPSGCFYAVVGYLVGYFMLSLYRTLKPLRA